MCWIIITTKDKLRTNLLNQKDRWLDSIGIISKDSVHRVVRQNYKWYKNYIRKYVKDNGMLIMHHRKATIWAISEANAHPFQWKYFQLMQNGTASQFYSWNKLKYKKETDSETLLHYIEDRTSSIEEIPSILEQLSDRLLEDLGIVIIIDLKNNKFLFYSDGARESYIQVDWMNMKVLEITNYVPWQKSWYENVWYMILDFDMNIIENTFNSLNTIKFNNYYSWKNWLNSFVPNKHELSYWYDWHDNWIYEWYGNDNNRYYNPKTYNLTNSQLEERREIVGFLSNEWGMCNFSNMSVEKAFEDYLMYNYWITMEDFPEDYIEYGIEFEEIFNDAYDEVFGF